MPSIAADQPLARRYGSDAWEIFDSQEQDRFFTEDGRPRDPAQLPWELLYRLEPELYQRLIAGENIHPTVLDFLPADDGQVLEIGAGTGRLTLELASRAARIVAIEPAAALRSVLISRLKAGGFRNVDVVRGFFDDLPAEHPDFHLVVSCSAFAPAGIRDPEGCLRSMEGGCGPGGMVAFVWPSGVDWLQSRGYEYLSFEGDMSVEFPSLAEALEIAEIFYPDAVGHIKAAGSRFVDYATLGINPPRDLCWKVIR